MSEANTVIAAFSEEQVQRLTGLTVRQLRYWARTGFFRPSQAHDASGAPYSRIYSFRDVVALRTLGVLRNEHDVPLQHLRKVATRLGHLRQGLWSKTTLYVLNRRVYFQDETGSIQGAVDGQYPLKLPLTKIANDVAAEAKLLKKRRADQRGKVERHRHVAHNAWVVAGTRIPVAAIRRFSEAGYSVDAIKREYPSLTREDIEASLAHETPLAKSA